MESPKESATEESPLEVRSYFVRERNALLTRAHLGELYLDYYLHQGQIGNLHLPFHDGMLKEALAAIVLHAASRPWNETAAWTIHFEKLGVNLFVVGDNPKGRVVGQVFTEDVRKKGYNLFCADVVRGTASPGRSTVQFPGDAVLPSVEWFYKQSEQRVARLFEVGPEDFVMVSAQPDCQEGWIEGLTLEAVRALDTTEQLSLLETRHYRWECGCNQARMLDILVPVLKGDPEGLFGEEPAIRMSCPRCGTKYLITWEILEAHANR